MFNTYFIIIVYLLSKYLCHICNFNREIGPTSNNCNGKAAIKFIPQAVKYALTIFSGNSGRINRPKTDIKVTILVTSELLPLLEAGASWEVSAFVSQIYLPSSSGSPCPVFFIFLISHYFFSNVSYIQCRIVISINFNSTALTFITSF